MSWGPKQTMEEGFEKFVIRKNGCWDWKGCCPNPGYPQFRTNKKLVRGHQASWIIHYGIIPKGMFVCHHCDNRKCTNPKHLFLATCAENNIDMMLKGRSPILCKCGEENPMAKLTNEQVLEIKQFLDQGLSQTFIANKFCVSQSTVHFINIGKAWRRLFLRQGQ